jgi:uncharacterized membrane-anchored protein
MRRTALELLNDRDHPLRRSLVEELHVRRFPPFAAPLEMVQILMFTAGTDPADVRHHAESLCARHGKELKARGRYFSAELGDTHFVWECHTEFTSYSFIRTGPFTEPFQAPILRELPLDWVEALPGRTIRATNVAVLERSAQAPDEAFLRGHFGDDEIVCADVWEGEARIWSSFRLHEDGFGRLLVQDLALGSPGDTSRLLQRLQEVGNYRNMALLGLPLAHAFDAELTTLEGKLASLTREIAEHGGDDHLLFQNLSALSSSLARLMADTRYRMSATSAYARIVEERLAGLQPRRVPGYQTLIDFTERRLAPAVRTCESFTERLEDLAERASWVSSLIRTRIETTLSRQNTDLLRSMNRRTRMQLRLQQTVEGLSVLAISYYAIGLIGYMLKPLAHSAPQLDTPAVLGIAAPVVVAVVWYCIRRLRRAQVGGEEIEAKRGGA